MRRRSGFTLVELLVVISIIGMLMALLFPAVQAARETGRQNTCRNNIRNLALAIIQYEKASGLYPGYVNEMHPNSDYGTPRSWVFAILPQLERHDLYEAYAMDHTHPHEDLAVLHCPTNPDDGANQNPKLDFVVNAGLPDFQMNCTPPLPPGPDWIANGIFHDSRDDFYGTDCKKVCSIPGPKCQESYVSVSDGTTNTLLLAENVDAASWLLQSGSSWERQLAFVWYADMATPSTPGAADGITGPPLENRINRHIGEDPLYLDIKYARPASYHPNIVNVAFCDGHVRTLSQDIDYLVYTQLMTPRGRDAKFVGVQTQVDPVFRVIPLDEKNIQ